MFPGIDPEKIKGKYFESMAIDVQNIKDGKIKRTWHFEDWTSIVDQVLRGKPAPTFRNPTIKPGQYLTEVPQCINNLYENFFSNILYNYQNEDLLSQTVHKVSN